MNIEADLRIASSIIGAMGANGVLQLNQTQLLNALSAAQQVSKYNNIPAIQQILRNISPLKGYFQ